MDQQIPQKKSSMAQAKSTREAVWVAVVALLVLMAGTLIHVVAFCSPTTRSFHPVPRLCLQPSSIYTSHQQRAVVTSNIHYRHRHYMLLFGDVSAIGPLGWSLTKSHNKVPSNRRHSKTSHFSFFSSLQEEYLPTEEVSKQLELELFDMKDEKSTILVDDINFIKSDLDKRKYRSIVLKKNNLQVLLISDPETDIESGAIHIKAGHFDDPPDRAGLAHFHEHMLFLGTEKYPVENEFEEFLGRNGGSSNAFTDMEDTNYYFSVAPLDHEEDEDNKDNEEGILPHGHDTEEVAEENDEYHINSFIVNKHSLHSHQHHEATIDGDTKVSAALAGALDRFAQFVISPTFNADSMERELRAIDSEYLNGITSDAWRNYQLLKSRTDPNHPFSKFGCGNYNTLTNGGVINTGTNAEESGGSSPRNELIRFWTEKYCGENMKLCIVGRANIDALQRTVEECFEDVRSMNDRSTLSTANQKVSTNSKDTQKKKNSVLFASEHAKYGIAAFGSDQLGIIRETIPLVEMRSVKLYFSTPPMDDEVLQRCMPFNCISHLLGHESPGSLHALLLSEGFISDLSSGVGIDTSDFSLCTITLGLTERGMAQRDHVILLVWQWINLVKSAVNTNSELMTLYHDELRQISANDFRFRENGDPTDFCSRAAEMLFKYSPENILVGSSRPGPYDPNVTRQFMERFEPDNCIVSVVSSDLATESTARNELSVNGEWKTEKYYRSRYREQKISKTLRDQWQNAVAGDTLHLPNFNSFIPSDFSLRSEDADSIASLDPKIDYSKSTPELILTKPGLRLWHKLDRTFKVPKTALRIHLTSPSVYRSPRTMTLSRLFQKVLNDDLNSYVYDASMAGSNYRVVCVPSGYTISLTGYSEKLLHLLDVVAARIRSLIEEMKQGDEAHPGLALKFSKAKQTLLIETKNIRLESPYETANYNSRVLIEDNIWHVSNYIAEMEGEYAEKDPLTMKECAVVAEESFTRRLLAEVLCMGNINEDGARDVAKTIDRHFLSTARPLTLEEIPKVVSLKIPTKEEAMRIFGGESRSLCFPLVFEDVAFSESEENHAVEIMLQIGSEHEVGYKGVAILELIGHMAYNSAYNQLRTKEQLGYIVSASPRKTAGGAQGLSVVVQSSTTLPLELEVRCQIWLEKFREELELMAPDRIAMEAAAVVAQLLERNMRFKDEVNFVWGEILATEGLGPQYSPAFDRLERLADELSLSDEKSCVSNSGSIRNAEQLKQEILMLWDKYIASNSPDRRAMSTRIYGNKGKQVYETNKGSKGVVSSYEDARRIKHFLSSFPTAPYWIKS